MRQRRDVGQLSTREGKKDPYGSIQEGTKRHEACIVHQAHPETLVLALLVCCVSEQTAKAPACAADRVDGLGHETKKVKRRKTDDTERRDCAHAPEGR